MLGKCPNNSLLITRRHHRVKFELMRLLREKKFTCFDEVYCIDSEGSTRYADIVAFPKTGRTALILDPTVRFESNDLDQAGEVEREKKNTYDKCIPFLKEKFRETFGEREFTVRGLWFGSRGTIPKRTRSFLEELGVDIKDVARLAENIVLDSLGIIHHHVHG